MEDLDVGRGVVIPGEELRVRFSRSSGPGGQNVNKRSTRVEILFDVASSPTLGPRRRARALNALGRRLDDRGVLRVTADSARAQAMNRAIALERLRRLLEEALKPPPPLRRPTRPSASSTERRIKEKKRRASVKRLRSTPAED